jgi:hypothetical protein
MKKTVLFAMLMMAVNYGWAQAPAIQWQKCFGGTQEDKAYAIQQTSDGGYIVAGTVYSNDGDVIGNHSNYSDIWVVKLNATGSIQWQKSLGGTNDEGANYILQTNDGGYIVAGYATSNDGDVTGLHGSPVNGNSDYWIVKLNASGTIQWQKSLGGTYDDYASFIQQTNDGGYIVCGESTSNDGDVTINHGIFHYFDYWVVKLDAVGTIQWQKSLGGTSIDVADNIKQTNDGGYIVCGESTSNDGDVTGHHGATNYGDCWVVKLDANGGIQWQKSYGGTNNDDTRYIEQTTDGGYIIAGSSNSNDGDVTGHHGTTNFTDFWVVKIDASGAIQWQKSFGGTNNDMTYFIQQTADGGYIVGGSSNSNDGDVTANHGSSDYWIVKLDATGSIQWQKSIGGSGADFLSSIHLTLDGGYIVSGWTSSNNGDITGNHGNFDFNVVKLAGTNGIEEHPTATLSIAPNPVKDVLHITTPQATQAVEVVDVYGRIIQHSKSNIQNSIDCSSWPSGLYLVRCTMQDGSVVTGKVVKE